MERMVNVDELEATETKLTEMRALLRLYMRSFGTFETREAGYILLSEEDKDLIEVNLVILNDMIFDELERLGKVVAEAYKAAREEAV